jgi:hypothetical protein
MVKSVQLQEETIMGLGKTDPRHRSPMPGSTKAENITVTRCRSGEKKFCVESLLGFPGKGKADLNAEFKTGCFE